MAFGSTTLTSAGEVDAYVVKINPQGQYLWAVRGGGDGRDVASALALDGAGHVLITGYFDGRTAAFGTTTLANSIPNPGPYGGANLLVARLDAATGAWQRAVGGTGNIGGTRIGADAQGGVYVGGGVAGTTASLGPFALNNAPDQGGDIVLAKLSEATGTWQWAVRGREQEQKVWAKRAVDGTGHVYAAGGFSAYGGSVSTFGPTILSNLQGRDTFVIRLDAGTGVWQWAVQPDPTRTAAQYGGFSLQQMLVDGQGHLFLVGTMSSQTVRFGPTTLTTHSVARPLGPLPNTATYYYDDVVVAQLDADTGTWGWAVNAGGLGDDQATACWLDRTGRPTLNGGFADAPPAPGLPPVQGCQFGATTLASANGTGFLARLDPATVTWGPVDQVSAQLAFYGPWLDPTGNLYGMAGFGGTSASVGGRVLTAWGNCGSWYVGRLGGLLLPVVEPTGTPPLRPLPQPKRGHGHGHGPGG